MLKRSRQTGSWDIAQLMDELIAQVPTFKRVTGNVADPDMGQVHGTATWVEVVFADDIDPGLVDAVLDAHVPRAPAPPRDFKSELRAIPGIPAELKSWLEAVLGL